MPPRKPDQTEELLKAILEEIRTLRQLILAHSPDHIIRKFQKLISESK